MKIIEKIKAKQANIWDAPPVTIAFSGDSVTQGCFESYLTTPTSTATVFEYESGYTVRLKQILNLLYPNVQINLVNSGVSGATAADGLKHLDRDVLSHNPDLVVVAFALNDSCNGLEGLSAYRESLSKIVQKVLKSGAECIVLTPNMMNDKNSPHLREPRMFELAEQFSAIQCGGVLDTYVQTARDIAGENGCILCDVYAKWKAMSAAGVDTTELLANKFNHPIRQLHYLPAIMLCECMLES